MGPLWRSTRRATNERRRLPRIPLAVPVRYATDQGHAGIGVLIDVHEAGAGLLVPIIAPDAYYIWMQFLWFTDQLGLHGRVAFVRETPDGFHVGLELAPLAEETFHFLTSLLIPYGLRKFRYDRKHLGAFLRALFGMYSDPPLRFRRKRYLPLLVEQAAVRIWAVTEDRTERGAVLLLPRPLEDAVPLKITTWGRFDTRDAVVSRRETVALPPVTLYRIGILFEPAWIDTAAPAEAGHSVAASTSTSGADGPGRPE